MHNLGIAEKICGIAQSGVLTNKEIYIFGANGYAEGIVKQLSAHNHHLMGILDNASDKQNTSIEGVAVLCPSALREKASKAVVLIASSYFFEMLAQIEQLGFTADVNVFNLLPNLERDDVERFFRARAEMDTSKLPLIENIVHPFNGDNDKEISQRRYELEGNCIKEHFSLNKSNVLVDLGAGIGQWSRLLASQVKKVYAVELVDKLSEMGKKLTLEEGISNIEYIAQPAETFTPPLSEKSVDRVLISGLLCFMDDKQCDQVATNVGRFLKCGGELFLRETAMINGFPFLKPAGNSYPAIYRTPDMLINLFSREGFVIKKCGRFFAEGSSMDTLLTRLYYFVFTKVI